MILSACFPVSREQSGKRCNWTIQFVQNIFDRKQRNLPSNPCRLSVSSPCLRSEIPRAPCTRTHFSGPLMVDAFLSQDYCAGCLRASNSPWKSIQNSTVSSQLELAPISYPDSIHCSGFMGFALWKWTNSINVLLVCNNVYLIHSRV